MYVEQLVGFRMIYRTWAQTAWTRFSGGPKMAKKIFPIFRQIFPIHHISDLPDRQLTCLRSVTYLGNHPKLEILQDFVGFEFLIFD